MNCLPALRKIAVISLVALLFHPGAVQACAMCMGGADSRNGGALNGAIFLMLGCLGAMLAGIVTVAYSFVKRARSIPTLGHDAPVVN